MNDSKSLADLALDGNNNVNKREKFAHYMKELLDDETHSNLTIYDLTGTGDRYSVFKVKKTYYFSFELGSGITC